MMCDSCPFTRERMLSFCPDEMYWMILHGMCLPGRHTANRLVQCAVIPSRSSRVLLRNLLVAKDCAEGRESAD